MFNLGFSEIVIIGIIALVFIGPKELPDIARVIGRMLNELKRATGDLSQTILQPKQRFEEEIRQSLQSIKEDILDPNHKGDPPDPSLMANEPPTDQLPVGQQSIKKDEPKS